MRYEFRRHVNLTYGLGLGKDLAEVLKRQDYDMPQLLQTEAHRDFRLSLEEAHLALPCQVDIHESLRFLPCPHPLHIIVQKKAPVF
jgi:hypothetical protein